MVLGCENRIKLKLVKAPCESPLKPNIVIQLRNVGLIKNLWINIEERQKTTELSKAILFYYTMYMILSKDLKLTIARIVFNCGQISVVQ